MDRWRFGVTVGVATAVLHATLAAQTPSSTQGAAAQVEADEAARLRGDSAA